MNRLEKWTRAFVLLPLSLLGACSQDEKIAAVDPAEGTEAPAALTSDPSRKQVAGCWRLTQGSYRGVLNLRQEGSGLKGFMDWDNHADAIVEGSVSGNRVNLTFVYLPPKGTLVGQYTAALSADGRSMSGTTGGTVAFSAVSQACAEVSGCWRLDQDGGMYTGILNLVWKAGGYVNGFMDWDNHEDASVSGSLLAGKLSLTLTYRGAKTGLVGKSEAFVSADGMTLSNGITWDVKFPEDKRPWSGSSIPCKDISGCFAITQTNADGGVFTGTFALTLSGDTTLSGSAAWTNHPNGVLQGSLQARRVNLTQTFPGTPKEGLVGWNTAVIDPQGDHLTQGTTRSNTGDAGVFHGIRSLCPLP